MTRRGFLFGSSLFFSATVVLPATIYGIYQDKQNKKEDYKDFDDQYRNDFWNNTEISDASKMIVLLRKKLWHKTKLLRKLKQEKNKNNKKKINNLKAQIKVLKKNLEKIIQDAKKKVKIKLIKVSNFREFKVYG